mgnify:CR=1 FL=1
MLNFFLPRIREVSRGWNATNWSIMTSFDWRMFANNKFDGQTLYSLARRLGSLKRVDLTNCETISTETIIDALSEVPSLTALNLAGTNIHSTAMIHALDKLQRIRRLNLSYTAINDRVVAKICNLYTTNLRELRIDSCQVSIDTPAFCKLNQLEILSLKQCRKLSPAAMDSIKLMTNLQELRLVNNYNITSHMVNDILSGMKHLKIFELGFYDLTAELCETIIARRLASFTLHQLKSVDIKFILQVLQHTKNYTHKGKQFIKPLSSCQTNLIYQNQG